MLKEYLRLHASKPLRFDYSIDSLKDIWTVVEMQIEKRPLTKAEYRMHMNAAPDWFKEEYAAETTILTTLSLVLGQDVGIYFAEILRYYYPKFYWGVQTKPKSLYNRNRPVLLGIVNNVCLIQETFWKFAC